MVLAILDGSKTQTRRIVKPQPEPWSNGWSWKRTNKYEYSATSGNKAKSDHCMAEYIARHCRHGQPGDQLWVRETFAIVPRTAYAMSKGVEQIPRPDNDHDAAIYRARFDRAHGGIRWRPSIHMPRWASRITLEITGVRVERLQEISDADAIAEGVEPWTIGEGWREYGLTEAQEMTVNYPMPTARRSFQSLWQSINGASSWDANPWVWVIEFKRAPSLQIFGDRRP